MLNQGLYKNLVPLIETYFQSHTQHKNGVYIDRVPERERERVKYVETFITRD